MIPRQIAVKLLQKTKLNRLAHKLYYNYIQGFNTANPAVLEALERSFDKAIELGVANNGDYFEFGLFKGYSFWYAQKAANDRALKRMRFFGFDSFKGLPDIGEVDATSSDDFYAGQFACSYDRVVENLNTKGVDWNRSLLVEGYYGDSLVNRLAKKHGMNPVAVALIDCDLYHSTRSVMDFLGSMLIDGSVLMMDDWNCFDADDAKGQRKALVEFQQMQDQWRFEDFFSYGTWGRVFITRSCV